MDKEKTTMKRYCGSIELTKDFNVNKIIVNALMENEHEVVSYPNIDENNQMIENIDIFEIREYY